MGKTPLTATASYIMHADWLDSRTLSWGTGPFLSLPHMSPVCAARSGPHKGLLPGGVRVGLSQLACELPHPHQSRMVLVSPSPWASPRLYRRCLLSLLAAFGGFGQPVQRRRGSPSPSTICSPTMCTPISMWWAQRNSVRVYSLVTRS